jgi:NADH-quinone oxidoreductase subunit L
VLVLTLVSVAVAFLGIAVGWLLYGSGRIDWIALRGRFRGAHSTLQHGGWFDTVYGWVLVTPGKAGAAFTAYVVDRKVVDGAGNVVARFFGLLANAGRRLQTGVVRVYALAFLLGVVALLSFLAVKF